jgi:ribosome-binding factor A
MGKYSYTRRRKVLFKAPYDKRPLKDEQWPCDDVREGDGKDPRFDTDNAPSKSVANRKARQLCAQVATAIGLALGESHNDSLRDLYVESVIPAPDSTQLLVTLVQHQDFNRYTTYASADEILVAVHGASGWIRTEVANAISRKRVPQLKFVVK